MSERRTIHERHPACFYPVSPDFPSDNVEKTLRTSAAGFCGECGVVHSLGAGAAHSHAQNLMDVLRRQKRIDLCSADGAVDPRFGVDYLFGKARGQMFGVLLCRHQDGTLGILKAFSCQYNGCWAAAGWVPPLFDEKKMHELVVDVECEIKAIGRDIENPGMKLAHEELRCRRKELSRQLMLDIHGLYRLNNFRGDTKGLRAVFDCGEGKGVPTGAGDCCAPKLLNYAAQHGLTPLGIAEFYWGRENKSATRRHGEFYSACSDKCAPILGFLLCGIN